MRLDDLPTSDRVEDRRGIPGGRAGLGIGTVVILGLIGWALGIDPRVLIGGAKRCPKTDKHNNRPMQAELALRERQVTKWGTSSLLFSEAPKQSGRKFSLALGKPISRRRWSCSPGRPNPGVVSRKQRWGRSTARSIKRSISTQVSFKTSSGAFVRAMSGASRASSRRHM